MDPLYLISIQAFNLANAAHAAFMKGDVEKCKLFLDGLTELMIAWSEPEPEKEPVINKAKK